MDDERLPPKNFCLSLPALTAGEAEALLSFVDTLQNLLWDAYGEHVFPPYGDPESHIPAFDLDDSPDF